MVLMTMVARVADGLPLAASMQEDEQIGRSIMEYQNQAKQLFRKMSTDPQPPARCSIETGQLIFHYYIERGVCYLVLCDQSFSKRLAFSYLEDLQTEFSANYGSKVETVSRPYSFIEFDTYIQKTRKSYMDSRARKNLSNINHELHDVQRIMVQNIDDVLQRGEALSGGCVVLADKMFWPSPSEISDVLDSRASNLSSLSQKYKKDAKYLNLKSSYAKIAAIIIVIVIFLLFIRYWII